MKYSIEPNVVYNFKEMCQILGISDATLRRWIKDAKVPVVQVGRAYKILGSNLIKLMEPPSK